MRQYETFELCYKLKKNEKENLSAELSAVFMVETDTIKVKGFYAGNGIYKIRFLPQKAGEYSWKVYTNLSFDGSLALEGSEICESAKSGRHGLVKPDGIHLKYEDGMRYIAIGTTVYAMMHQQKQRVDDTIQTLQNNSFTKVRLCLFPKHYDFNNNEPELFPFKKTDDRFDVSKPCHVFWDRFEERLLQLQEMGIEVDLILFHPYDHWGFAQLSKEECKIYMDYLLRRFSAIPNLWWSLANEYDLMEYFDTGWWVEFAQFVHDNDPYGHMLSNHHCVTMWDFSNQNTTHCCLQSSAMTIIPDLQEKYKKPVVIDECGYEGNLPYSWGNLSAFEMVNRFWLAFTLGGYCTHGETFLNEDEVLWWAKGGELIGESPKRIGFLRQLMEEMPGDIECARSRWDRKAILTAIEDPQMAATIPTVVKCIAKMPDAQFTEFMASNREIEGHCGEEAYIYYYGRHCTRWADISLPQDKTYRVEIIDVWEMTRREAMAFASGQTRVILPGKEGMAVIAWRNQ